MQNQGVLNFSKFLGHQIEAYFLLNPNKTSRENNLNSIGFNLENTAIPDQVHGNKVKWIDNSGEYYNVDGLVSSNSNLILSLKVADCVPVYLYDPKSKIIALIHSGWKGTKGKIVSNGVNIMVRKGAQLDSIRCFLGPSIGQCCYEVNKDVSRFYSNEAQVVINSNKVKLNIKLQIKIELERIGILPQNINISNICTFEQTKFHSYRRDKINAGRMYAILKRKK